MANQFQEARDRFLAATSYVKYPLTWESWMSLEDNMKVAALFVNFYPQIILAYNKQKTYFLEEEDAVSHVWQYFMKNVEKISEDKKRFTPNYIYRVAYNSINGFVRVPKRREYTDNTQSQWFTLDGEDHDIFEILEDKTDIFKDAKFNEVLSTLSDAELKYVSHFIWGTRLTKADLKKKDVIVSRLKELFAEFRDDDAADTADVDDKNVTVTFADVYSIDDEIKSAVVTMSDGESAVYYGEKQVNRENKAISIVFFGATKDYIVPLDIAKTFTVSDIECYMK